MLDRLLSTADMAALAMQATMALPSSSKPRCHERRRAHGGGKMAVRVMPMRKEIEDGGEV
jgi:hypothetical protein